MGPQSPAPVVIADYDAGWPEAFQDLKQALEAGLGPLALAIEHVGSTAVPGLAAKPIIDLDVVIESVDRLPQAIAALARLGYVHQGDRGIAGREMFWRLGPDVPRDGSGRSWPEHHLYVCARDSAELARHLAFRDYLRAHPKTAAAYAKLKRGLARRFPRDREAYSRAKTEFVAAALRRAKG